MTRLLTFPARRSKRVGRAFSLLFCAALALSASCSHDYSALTGGPTTPALIPGTFVLVAVQGSVLPYNPPNSNVTFISGDCVTTSEKFTLSVTTTTGTAAPVATASSGVILDLNKGSVIFHFNVSSVQATALITGNGFVLTYQGLNLAFERVA